MSIKRENLYRLPWSKVDNPGGWVEVTDECDLYCPGCYRYRLEGHRPLDEVKNDIMACKKITNCHGMSIAGGEPLIYPPIVEVVNFISEHNMKPVILTNGEKLTWELAYELKKAGLAKIFFHVDSGQERPGWTGKTEAELNKLRQYFADLIWELGGVHCAYNVTVFGSTLKYIPEIVNWCRNNVHKVQHLHFIAARGIPKSEGIQYMVNGKKIDLSPLSNNLAEPHEISISSEEMFEIIANHFPDSPPCAYLNGTTAPETYKFLVIVYLGNKRKIFGGIGAKTAELTEIFTHLLKGRYRVASKNPHVGKKVFLLSIFDKEVRKSFINFLKTSMRNPVNIFDKIYSQTLSLHQPREIYRGETNLCDGCINMMIYKGKLINSCGLDEYRLFGGPIQPIFISESKK